MRIGTVVVIAFGAWVIPLIALSAWLSLTPNVWLAQADVGAVVVVRTEHRWLPSEDTTTLHTTLGEFEIEGIHSLPRGERLVVRVSTKDGEQLCAGSRAEACADFAGSFMGALRTVHAPVVLSHAVRNGLWAFIAFWTLILGLAFAMLTLFWLVDRANGCASCGAGEGSA